MKMVVKIPNQHDAELFLNVLTLGILTALHHQKITIDDAEKILFRPGAIEYLEGLAVEEKYLRALWLGTELEDIESLLPQNLGDEIVNLIRLTLSNFSGKELSDNLAVCLDWQQS